ncbi:MAG: phosphonate metabolism transcriptional regulator PhnF [Pseudomonadota bacterium]
MTKVQRPDPRQGRSAPDGLTRWKRIADALTVDVAAGTFAPGSRLPTEEVLARRFGANRHTVRRALAHLAAEGRVEARRGSGTFVTDAPVLYPITARTRFGEIMRNAKQTARSERLGYHIAPASDAVARKLGLERNSAVLILETRRAMGERWASVASHVLRAELADGLLESFDRTGSLSEAFANVGNPHYRRARSEISAALAGERLAELLDIAVGAPVLVVDALDVDSEGVPLQCVHTTFAAGVVSLLVETD